ncbi:enoyl-CoA hydratase-related protein [Streptacidiphilus fuscans]|uniref:Hydrogenase maturation protein n=1 Tax=Streptacidiphilus fuscans TaxID=2789292 RepID=A0A931FFV5_9ACTN|nr:enoyl-CoA hydratase-related protein [Streptacidiphilus fuscans]MBF9068794.1 hydrogenase maturation protein [Streptacidiphilus fuscans]
MEILLVASAFNSLTQRVFAALRDRGHTVGVELASGAALVAAVRERSPELIVAPMLKTAVPDEVWTTVPCLIVHPGPLGDRGPSSLDRAVQDGCSTWGVTVLQAEAEMDAGPVWATVDCPLPPRGKSDLYRNEIADAALEAVLLAVERFASRAHEPAAREPGAHEHGDRGPLSQHLPEIRRRVVTRPFLRQPERRIDWSADSTADVLRKLRAADSQPGVLDDLLDGEWFLHGGHEEDRLRGRPGELLATRHGAVCRATVDGAVWIPQLRPRRTPGAQSTFALPATLALGARLPQLHEEPVELELPADRRTWTDIRYREHGEVGMLSFSFAGGAMGTSQCRRLLDAYREACSRPTSVLVLGGQRDFFGNGIHLNVIEAAADPGLESWANINAIDDLVEAVLTTTDRLVVAALGGNAAAGGAMLALAADEVWCRDGVVLNPHYRLMGLTGSEFWTLTLPRRVGLQATHALVTQALPVSVERAVALGLVERAIVCPADEFGAHAAHLAEHLAAMPGTPARIARKKAALERQEAERPLRVFREAELERMHTIFFDPEQPYHALRRAFVHKHAVLATPEHLRPPLPRTPQGRPPGQSVARSAVHTSL